MLTRGAIIRGAPSEYEVVCLEVDDPRGDEIQVKVVASGLCHSDDHMATGDVPAGKWPLAGGHEGAGIVVKAPPNRKRIAEGDHVIFSFLPSCGYCRFCATAQQNLCQLGANVLTGARRDDPNDFRLRLAATGETVGQCAGISTFVETTTVSVDSAIKIDDDLPLETVCLLGCGVGTGWGSAVNAAAIQPEQTVIIMGVGGVGINAVQGAKHAGAGQIIAVDPVSFKREKALELGATHAFGSMEEASEVTRQFTDGQGADASIVTVGVVQPAHVAQAFSAIRKGGVCVVTGVAPFAARDLPISLFELTQYQKRIQGALFGQCNPNWDILRQVAMYRSGALKLDELITTRYKLDEVAQGFRDMKAGVNIRGVIVHSSEG